MLMREDTMYKELLRFQVLMGGLQEITVTYQLMEISN